MFRQGFVPLVVEGFVRCGTVEGVAARDQFVERHAERIDVGSRIDPSLVAFVGNLFRSGILRGSDELPDSAVAILQGVGHAEIRQFHAGVAVDHDIRRLDILVYDSVVVQILQGRQNRTDVFHDPQGPFLLRKGGEVAPYVFLERHALDVLAQHEHRARAVEGLAKADHPHDVRMSEDQRRFAPRAFPDLFDPGVLVPDPFDRHVGAGCMVESQVNGPGSAFSQRRVRLVVEVPASSDEEIDERREGIGHHLLHEESATASGGTATSLCRA